MSISAALIVEYWISTGITLIVEYWMPIDINDFSKVLNALRIQAKEILDAVLPEHPTEILDAPGINATEILDAPGINATEILDALEHTFTRILDAFRQDATEILDARSRIIQAQTSPVRSQILDAAD
jgi:hypothetical protein